MPLFTGVRGETVWKIGMSPGIGVPKAAKWGRRDTDRPLPAAKEARLKGLQLFSKQFRKVNSAKFGCSILYGFGYRAGGRTVTPAQGIVVSTTCGSAG
jgi:hypothetical protein